jgi:hypothetical protein
MLVNHISTDKICMARQKKTLMKAWNKFKNVMSDDEKRDYQLRLFTIKHIEDGICKVTDSKYFQSDIVKSYAEKVLF